MKINQLPLDADLLLKHFLSFLSTELNTPLPTVLADPQPRQQPIKTYVQYITQYLEPWHTDLQLNETERDIIRTSYHQADDEAEDMHLSHCARIAAMTFVHFSDQIDDCPIELIDIQGWHLILLNRCPTTLLQIPKTWNPTCCIIDVLAGKAHTLDAFLHLRHPLRGCTDGMLISLLVDNQPYHKMKT